MQVRIIVISYFLAVDGDEIIFLMKSTGAEFSFRATVTVISVPASEGSREMLKVLHTVSHIIYD